MADLGTELVADLATDQSGSRDHLPRARRARRRATSCTTPRSSSTSPGSAGRCSAPARKPLDDPGGEALLDAEPGPLHRPAARGRGRRRHAAQQPLRGRAADGGAALRLVARPAHRPLRPAQLRPPARDVGGPQPPVPLAVHAGRHRPRRAQGDQRHPGPRRPATRRCRRWASASAGSCDSGTTRPASVATSSRSILPNTDPDDVPMLLERIGSTQLGDRPCPPFSYGVAQCPAEADDMDSLFKLADSRLYEAKKARR